MFVHVEFPFSLVDIPNVHFLRDLYLASSSEKVNYFRPIQMNFNMIFGPILMRTFFAIHVQRCDDFVITKRSRHFVL